MSRSILHILIRATALSGLAALSACDKPVDRAGNEAVPQTPAVATAPVATDSVGSCDL